MHRLTKISTIQRMALLDIAFRLMRCLVSKRESVKVIKRSGSGEEKAAVVVLASFL